MFNDLPPNASTIKVGKKQTAAKYFIKNPSEVKNLLQQLID
jgi:hypothetical protein